MASASGTYGPAMVHPDPATVIPLAGLIHLKAYKYSCVDKSIIAKHILQPFSNACVNLLPIWLAPNMVTLLGFFCIIANVGLLVLVMPDMVGPGPAWLYCSFALGLFTYQTMDNLDGKQARRTGTSSGLGELFDHGIDSLNCTLASLLETAAMGLGTSRAGVFMALCPCLPMFFSTWETYHTHTLFLGFFNGPTEGILIACGIMLASGLFGPAFWSHPIAHIVPDRVLMLFTPSLIKMGITLSDLVVGVILATFLFIHLPYCVKNVVQARRQENLPVAPVFLEWAPMLVFVASIVAWLGSPHSTLMADNHLVLFCLTMSFVFGRITTKTILAHLTRQPFPYWTVMLGPLVLGAVLANLPAFGLTPVFTTAKAELAYLWTYFFFAAAVYFHWAYVVVTAICDFLGINALTIPREKQKENLMKLQSMESQAASRFPDQTRKTQ